MPSEAVPASPATPYLTPRYQWSKESSTSSINAFIILLGANV
jgi:hypothetical protein